MADEASSVRGKTVLAADDNPDNLSVLSAMLSQAGFRVRIARDGSQALASARTEPPDILLLDVHMPAMDGYEACRAFKADAALADIPVVFVSALSDPFNKAQAFALGAVDYIEKPFKLEDVANRVKNALLLSYYRRRCIELEKLIAPSSHV